MIRWPWLVTDVWHHVISCDIMLTSDSKFGNEIERKIKSISLLSLTLTLLLLQDFFSRETNFHFCQFLSNFLKYSSFNFLSIQLYNIFAVYFSSNSPLLKSFSFILFNFSCYLTLVLILLSNSATTSFIFFKFSSFSHILLSTINPFHCTKYFTTSLIFLLFSIFSTSYSLTPSTSTGFTSSTFSPFICSLYYITGLTFITRWILIEVSSYNLTALVNTILSMIYGPTYWSTNLFASFFLNTKSFVLNIILLHFFHSSTFFVSLSTCCFISFCAFLNAAPASSVSNVFLYYLYKYTWSMLIINNPTLISICLLWIMWLWLHVFSLSKKNKNKRKKQIKINKY